MANEVKIYYTTGSTLYMQVWREADMKVWDAGDSAFEAPGTWNNTRMGQCDIALTEIAGTGWYQGTMPAIKPGMYYVNIFEQAGASPAITDICLTGLEYGGKDLAAAPSHQDKTTGDLVVWKGISLTGLTFDLAGGAVARKLAGSNGDFTGIAVTNPKTQIFLEAGASGGVLAGPYEVEAIDAVNAAYVGLVAHADLTADDTAIAASLGVAYRKSRNNRPDARVYGGMRPA